MEVSSLSASGSGKGTLSIQSARGMFRRVGDVGIEDIVMEQI
jgi:hypothetical protein